MLARILEEAGIATVLVAMMPDLAERFRLPRILGVEFPLAHNFGLPGDAEMQGRVLRAALALYEREDLPVREDLPIPWPVDQKTAYRSWQPREPSPIVAHILRERGREPGAARDG